MKRSISLVSLTAAGALLASSAFACPYMKQDQVTQAPMSPIASVEDDGLQSSIATNDIKVLPLDEAIVDDKADK